MKPAHIKCNIQCSAPKRRLNTIEMRAVIDKLHVIRFQQDGNAIWMSHATVVHKRFAQIRALVHLNGNVRDRLLQAELEERGLRRWIRGNSRSVPNYMVTCGVSTLFYFITTKS